MVSKTLAAATGCGLAALLLFAISVPASSAENASDAKAREAAAAEKFVAQRLRIWQERLNLTDWDIRFDMVRSKDLEPKTLGNVHWDTDVKTARISVMSTYDYTLPYKDMLKDMEFTVVHELVHLHLASLPRSDASRRVEEHAVNELAGALLKLADK
jgi:hypothetical protein